jgi:hypothetical protein
MLGKAVETDNLFLLHFATRASSSSANHSFVFTSPIGNYDFFGAVGKIEYFLAVLGKRLCGKGSFAERSSQ